MSTRPVDPDLDVYERRLARAKIVVADVYEHLYEVRGNVSVMSASGGGGTSGGDVGDPTMRTVLELDAVAYLWGRMDDAKATIGKCIDMLEDCARQALSHRAIREEVLDDTPQCIRSFHVETRIVDGEQVEVTRRCDRPVEHYIREDGTTGWRSSGLCAACRQADMRNARKDAAA